MTLWGAEGRPVPSFLSPPPSLLVVMLTVMIEEGRDVPNWLRDSTIVKHYS
jgi:hypothetical protein